MKSICVILMLAAVALVGAKKSYDGVQVIRMTPKSVEQLDALHHLEDIFQTIDFWMEPTTVGRPVDLLVPVEPKGLILEYLVSKGIEFGVIVADVQKLIEEEEAEIARNASPKLTWTSYGSLDEINQFMEDMNAAYDFTELLYIGNTYENRPMYVLRINRNPLSATKHPIFIQSTIHAREWVSSAVTTWTINEMLTDQATWGPLLDQWDMHWLVITNPDGFQYSKTNDRLWRKTRSVNSGTTCRGTDGNRNYDSHWSEPGASGNPCAETYYGSAPFSEPCTANVRDYIMNSGIAFEVFFDVHSYSQLFLLPWGWTASPLPTDFAQLEQVALAGEAALEAVHNTRWETGNVATILYPASGGSFDWAKEKAGIKYSMGFELRDTGTYGFLLPASQIIPSGEEFIQGFSAMLNEVISIGA